MKASSNALGFATALSVTLVAAALLVSSATYAQRDRPVVTEPVKVVQFGTDAKQICEGLPGCDFILLHGDPSKAASQWLLRLRAGQAFPKHWHNTPENMVGVQGALTFNFENGQRHTLRPGEYLHYQAGMIHWGGCEPGEDCLFYVFNDQPYDIHVVH